MPKTLSLSTKKWRVLSAAFSNMGQAVVLFSLATLFVPQSVNLPSEFPKIIALLFIFGGLILLGMGTILADR